MIFMIFLSSYGFLAMGFAQIMFEKVQSVCLSIDIDHSKFQPRTVSHRGAMGRAHCRHRSVLPHNSLVV